MPPQKGIFRIFLQDTWDLGTCTLLYTVSVRAALCCVTVLCGSSDTDDWRV